MHVWLRVLLIAVAVIAGVWITRARFGRKMVTRGPGSDDGTELAGVTAPVRRPPLSRSGGATVDEPDDHA
jgi:ribose/xylose/arabinose/galactoside ABC-type transport system permease subunit